MFGGWLFAKEMEGHLGQHQSTRGTTAAVQSQGHLLRAPACATGDATRMEPAATSRETKCSIMKPPKEWVRKMVYGLTIRNFSELRGMYHFQPWNSQVLAPLNCARQIVMPSDAQLATSF